MFNLGDGRGLTFFLVRAFQILNVVEIRVIQRDERVVDRLPPDLWLKAES